MIFDIFSLNYRGFSKAEKQWLYGHYLSDGKNSYIVDNAELEHISTSPTDMLVKGKMVDSSSLGFFAFEQDMGGNNLYTGDVIKTTVGGDSPFDDELFVLVFFDRQGVYGVYGDDYIEPDNFKFCELVGNTFENKDLLYACCPEDYDIDEFDLSEEY